MNRNYCKFPEISIIRSCSIILLIDTVCSRMPEIIIAIHSHANFSFKHDSEVLLFQTFIIGGKSLKFTSKLPSTNFKLYLNFMNNF